jgi:hypothetical protein
MRMLMISLSATTAFVLCGWVAQANPLGSSIGMSSQQSLIEKVGCRHSGDTCPYGKRIVRHSGHGTTCEPCEDSKKDDSKEDKSSSKKEESNEGRHSSSSSHYDQGRGDYDQQDEGYQRDEGYDRRDEGYAPGYQGRDRSYDPGDEGYSRDDDGYDQQGYGPGDGYDPREQGYDSRGEGYGRGYGPSREGDYGPYYERPYGWQQRDCLQVGPDWYCRQ